jgi:hypothetical protein
MVVLSLCLEETQAGLTLTEKMSVLARKGFVDDSWVRRPRNEANDNCML